MACRTAMAGFGLILAGCLGSPVKVPDVEGPLPRREADLLIRDVRIVVGDGRVIERGSVLVRFDRITRVVDGRLDADAIQEIDGRGRTLLPGFIDTHVHLVQESADCTVDPEALEPRLRRRLAQGFTTMQSASDPAGPVLAIKSALRNAQIFGPDLFVNGPAFAPAESGSDAPIACSPNFSVTDGDRARTEIRRLVAEGVDGITLRHHGALDGLRQHSVLGAVADEARRLSATLTADVGSWQELRGALALGIDRLAALPRGGEPDDALIAMLAERGVAVATGLQRPSPVLRRLHDAGVVLAFGTDAGPADEDDPTGRQVEALAAVLTPQEILTLMTHGAARYLGMQDEIGSIVQNRRADFVLVRGNPLQNLAAMRDVEAVIQRGLVVVDNRTDP